MQSDESSRFEKYRGQETVVTLISQPDNPLKTIGTKAFLSCKTIEKLILPDTLEMVEDWGFAHMKNLREIVLPAKEISFGKKVFLGCDNLEKVCLLRRSSGTLYEGMPYLLASMFRYFPESHLAHLGIAGDDCGQWKWLEDYDEALLRYIAMPHDYDFEPAFIGWFDVEDVDDQKEHFVRQQRKNKVYLAFRRLNYAEGLSEYHRESLQDFLLKEKQLVEQLFLDADEPLGKEVRDYHIWKQVGALDKNCADRLLAVIPEEEPEIRGYLLNIQLEHVENNDFFQELDL